MAAFNMPSPLQRGGRQRAGSGSLRPSGVVLSPFGNYQDKTMKYNNKIWALTPLAFALAACQPAGDFPDQGGLCDFDQVRENERAASAVAVIYR